MRPSIGIAVSRKKRIEDEGGREGRKGERLTRPRRREEREREREREGGRAEERSERRSAFLGESERTKRREAVRANRKPDVDAGSKKISVG